MTFRNMYAMKIYESFKCNRFSQAMTSIYLIRNSHDFVPSDEIKIIRFSYSSAVSIILHGTKIKVTIIQSNQSIKCNTNRNLETNPNSRMYSQQYQVF